MYAAQLATALRRHADLDLFGMGGPKMREAGVETVVDASEVGVLGVVEIVRKLPALRQAWRRLISEIERRRPTIAILTDFPAFHLRLARVLRRKRIRNVYFVCPAQAPRPVGFLADHYDISATLDSSHQSISAIAKIDFRATDASGSIRVELHPNLVVSDVKTADGKSVGFGRDSLNPLYVMVTLPTPIAAGAHVTLTFTYAGLLANEENSPVPGVRAAVIGHEDAYLLLPARWFPLTNYPSNRYTATFRLERARLVSPSRVRARAASPTPLGEERAAPKAGAFSTPLSARPPARTAPS